MNKLVIIGAICLLMGVFLISTSYDFTGFVVSNETGNYVGSGLGVILLIFGLILIITNREIREQSSGIEKITESEFQVNERALRKIRQIIQNRSAGDYKELVQLAENVGYEVVSGGEHFKVKYPQGPVVIGKGNKPVTIPRHGTPTKEMYLSILKNLYYGASSYSPQPA